MSRKLGRTEAIAQTPHGLLEKSISIVGQNHTVTVKSGAIWPPAQTIQSIVVLTLDHVDRQTALARLLVLG